MNPFAMETAAILVHSLNRFSLCTKMAAVAVAKLLLCCYANALLIGPARSSIEVQFLAL